MNQHVTILFFRNILSLSLAVSIIGSIFVFPSAQAVTLEILSTTPVMNSVGASRTTDITIVFNQSLNPATVTSSNVFFIGIKTGNLSGSLSVTTTNDANDTILFNPTKTLFAGERGEVIVTGNVQGSDGSTFNLSRGKVFDFVVEVTEPDLNFTQVATVFTQNGGSPFGDEKVLGDFNGDENLDLVVTHVGPDNFEAAEVYSGNGDGTFVFQTSFPYDFNDRPNMIHTGDFNLDGNLDFVVNLVNETAPIDVFFGNGDFTFTRVSAATNQNGARDIPITDFSGDGYQDVAWFLHSNNGAQVSLNNQNETFAAAILYPMTVSNSLSASMGDFNNDYFMDIVAASRNNSNVPVILGNGDGTFQASLVSTTSVFTFQDAVVPGDYDGDGDLDIAVRGYDGSNKMAILLNNGSGSFVENSVFSFSSSSAQAHDYDGDGDLDLIFMGGTALQVYKNDGNAGFATIVTVSHSNVDSRFTVGDVNNDGTLDIVATTGGNQIVSLLSDPLPTPPSPLPNTDSDIYISVEEFLSFSITNAAIADEAAGDQPFGTGTEILSLSNQNAHTYSITGENVTPLYTELQISTNSSDGYQVSLYAEAGDSRTSTLLRTGGSPGDPADHITDTVATLAAIQAVNDTLVPGTDTGIAFRLVRTGTSVDIYGNDEITQWGDNDTTNALWASPPLGAARPIFSTTQFNSNPMTALINWFIGVDVQQRAGVYSGQVFVSAAAN